MSTNVYRFSVNTDIEIKQGEKLKRAATVDNCSAMTYFRRSARQYIVQLNTVVLLLFVSEAQLDISSAIVCLRSSARY